MLFLLKVWFTNFKKFLNKQKKGLSLQTGDEFEFIGRKNKTIMLYELDQLHQKNVDHRKRKVDF